MPEIKDKSRLDRPPTRLERLVGIAGATFLILLLVPIAGILVYGWAIGNAPVAPIFLLVLCSIVALVSILLYRMIRGTPRALSQIQVIVVSGVIAFASLGLVLSVALYPARDASIFMVLAVGLSGLATSIPALLHAKSALKRTLDARRSAKES